jgi:hypothetical protein
MDKTKSKNAKKHERNSNPPIPPPPSITTESGEGNREPSTPYPSKEERQVAIEKIPPVRIKKDFVNITIQFIIALGTIASVLIVWCMTSQQNRNTENILKATQRSSDIADSNYIIENRAWMALQMNEPPRAQIVADDSGGYVANITWKINNIGKTPAEDVHMGHSTCISNVPDFRNRKIIYELPYTFAPGEERSYSCDHKITNDAVIRSLNTKRSNLFLYGIIAYKDIYGRSDTTEFIFAHAGYNLPMTPVGINRIK